MTPDPYLHTPAGVPTVPCLSCGPHPAGGELPRTGGDPLAAILLVLVFVVAGVLLVAASKLRARS